MEKTSALLVYKS